MTSESKTDIAQSVKAKKNVTECSAFSENLSRRKNRKRLEKNKHLQNNKDNSDGLVELSKENIKAKIRKKKDKAHKSSNADHNNNSRVNDIIVKKDVIETKNGSEKKGKKERRDNVPKKKKTNAKFDQSATEKNARDLNSFKQTRKDRKKSSNEHKDKKESMLFQDEALIEAQLKNNEYEDETEDSEVDATKSMSLTSMQFLLNESDEVYFESTEKLQTKNKRKKKSEIQNALLEIQENSNKLDSNNVGSILFNAGKRKNKLVKEVIESIDIDISSDSSDEDDSNELIDDNNNILLLANSSGCMQFLKTELLENEKVPETFYRIDHSFSSKITPKKSESSEKITKKTISQTNKSEEIVIPGSPSSETQNESNGNHSKRKSKGRRLKKKNSKVDSLSNILDSTTLIDNGEVNSLCSDDHLSKKLKGSPENDRKKQVTQKSKSLNMNESLDRNIVDKPLQEITILDGKSKTSTKNKQRKSRKKKTKKVESKEAPAQIPEQKETS